MGWNHPLYFQIVDIIQTHRKKWSIIEVQIYCKQWFYLFSDFKYANSNLNFLKINGVMESSSIMDRSCSGNSHGSWRRMRWGLNATATAIWRRNCCQVIRTESSPVISSNNLRCSNALNLNCMIGFTTTPNFLIFSIIFLLFFNPFFMGKKKLLLNLQKRKMV